MLLANMMTDQIHDQDLVHLFDEIVGQMNAHFPIFDRGGYRSSLTQSRDKFLKLPFKKNEDLITKQEVIRRILDGLHANANRKDLKIIGSKGDFGRLGTKKIYLSKDAKLIYTSPTCLFTRTVPLSSL